MYKTCFKTLSSPPPHTITPPALFLLLRTHTHPLSLSLPCVPDFLLPLRRSLPVHYLLFLLFFFRGGAALYALRDFWYIFLKVSDDLPSFTSNALVYIDNTNTQTELQKKKRKPSYYIYNIMYVPFFLFLLLGLHYMAHALIFSRDILQPRESQKRAVW